MTSSSVCDGVLTLAGQRVAMRTIKRTIAVFAALAIAVFAFAGVAGAQTDDEAGTGEATISGPRLALGCRPG